MQKISLLLAMSLMSYLLYAIWYDAKPIPEPEYTYRVYYPAECEDWGVWGNRCMEIIREEVE